MVFKSASARRKSASATAMIAFLATAFGAPLPAPAQEAASASRDPQQLPYFIPRPLAFDAKELEEIRNAAVSRNIAILNDQIAQAADRTAFAKERQAAAAIETDRRRWLTQHEQRVFGRQVLYSEIVFWISNAIVLCGLYLTFRQFTREEADKKLFAKYNKDVMEKHLIKGETTIAAALAEADGQETKIVLKADGIEFGSRITGLAILVISLAFYYLMLTHVYEIRVPQSAPQIDSPLGDSNDAPNSGGSPPAQAASSQGRT